MQDQWWRTPGYKEKLGALLVDLQAINVAWKITFAVEDDKNVRIAGYISFAEESIFSLRFRGLWLEGILIGLDVELLYIREDWRGKGLGTKIMRCVENLADSLGVVLRVDVMASEGFWTKLGYAPECIPANGPLSSLVRPYWVRNGSELQVP